MWQRGNCWGDWKWRQVIPAERARALRYWLAVKTFYLGMRNNADRSCRREENGPTSRVFGVAAKEPALAQSEANPCKEFVA